MAKRKARVAPVFDARAVELVRSQLPDRATIDRTSIVCAALSDPSRVAMLFALATTKELCVSDLAHVAALSLPSTSTHLRILRAGGLVQRRSEGRQTFYSLGDREFAALVRALLPRKKGGR